MLDETTPLGLTEAGMRYLADRRTVKGLSEETIASYRYAIASFLTTAGLPSTTEELRKVHWNDWTAEMRANGLRPGGIKTYQREVGTWLAWLYRNDHMSHQLCAKVESVTVREADITRITASDTDIRALILAAREGRNPLRDEATIRLMYDSGTRCGETARLELGDIVFARDADHSHIAAVRQSKTGKGRVTTFTERTGAALRRYITLVRGDEPGLLFGFRSAEALEKLFVRLSARATAALAPGSTPIRVTPHQVRRAMASGLSYDGMALEDIGQLLGHSDTRQTRIYAAVGSAAAALRAYRDVELRRTAS